MHTFRLLSWVFLGGMLAAAPVHAQIKLASVGGAPGAFDASTDVIFTMAGTSGYVSNPGSGVVKKFSVATGAIEASVELAAGIGPMTLSPNERTLAVLGVTTQIIYLIDTGQMQLRHEARVDGSGFTSLNNMVFSPDNSRLFIADPRHNRLAVFRELDGSWERFIALEAGINPNALRVVPFKERLFAVLCSGKKASDPERFFLIDSLNMSPQVMRQLDLTNTEAFNNIAFTVDGSYMFIPIYNESRMVAYDMNTFNLGSREVDGKGPSKAFVSPRGRWMALTCAESNSISIYTLPAAVLKWRLDIPEVSITTDTILCFSPDDRVLYIPTGSGDQVMQYDVNKREFLDSILTGADPTKVILNIRTETLASLDLGSNEISLININPTPTYLPDLVQTPNEYAGLAIANFSGESANVALVAKDNLGALLPGTSNPAIVTVPPNQQISL
ncbi:MAG: WD40 repeat domain-containing protein, partial [Acidobacteria bacterium]|nr:WD40 repeat domain-containing protein [Acidobacteriota bacterium]